MPAYDSVQFDPPAPVAKAVLCRRDRSKAVYDMPMLIDSAADLTLIPRKCVRELALREESVDAILEAFDGSSRLARVVNVDVHFLQHIFRGLFPVTEDECGILGRNVINLFSLIFDGPALEWREATRLK